jgi:hypothetical protein
VIGAAHFYQAELRIVTLKSDPLHQAESDVIKCERRAPQNKLDRDITTYVTFATFGIRPIHRYVFLVLQMSQEFHFAFYVIIKLLQNQSHKHPSSTSIHEQ